MLDREIITETCACGSDTWVLDWVSFSNFEIAAYSLTMHCFNCNAKAITPTPLDRPDNYEESGTGFV